jgi:hypothetical protein
MDDGLFHPLSIADANIYANRMLVDTLVRLSRTAVLTDAQKVEVKNVLKDTGRVLMEAAELSGVAS